MVKTRWMRWLAAVGTVAVVVLVVASCYTVPETGRKTLVAFSAEEEAKLGFDTFQELKKKEKLSNDPAANAQLQRVGKRISAVAQLPSAQWEFVVFENPEPNAFCLPGGKVGFHTGILPICQDDAGVATVMGHEVAHAVARHGGRRMTEQLGVQLLGAGLSVAMRDRPQQTQQLALMAYGGVATVGVALPFSRTDETEADHIGLLYMAKAGYDPNAAVAFWQRFSAVTKGGRTPEFLSTHPGGETRIANLKKWLPEAMPYYEAAKGKGGR